MPRPREVSDADIIRVAREVFRTKGTRVPVATIAKALGVSSATLFQRMGSKEKLIQAALWPPDPSVLIALKHGVLNDAPVIEQLVELLYQAWLYIDTEVSAAFIIYSAGLRTDPGEDFSAIGPMRIRRGLSRWLKQAADEGALPAPNPELAAEMLIGTLEARSLHGFIENSAYTPRQRRAFVHDIIDTLLALETPTDDDAPESE